jgi:CpeT protein
MLIRATMVVLALSLAACQTPASARVAKLLSGSYTSAAQAKADPEYFEVHLHMTPIWTSRSDGQWLYVEQAMATALDKPYRQRVYRVTDSDDGAVVSMVFELPNAVDRVGAWRTPAAFEVDSPDKLVGREGCLIRLEPSGEAWVGSTNGKDCLSSLRGASYATSEVKIFDGRLETWDRGFDANDTQVWGAKKGPYVFVKER